MTVQFWHWWALALAWVADTPASVAVATASTARLPARTRSRQVLRR